MAYARAIRFVTLFLPVFWLVPAAAAGPKPADQVFRLGVTLGEDEELDLNWSIEPGYYLYRDKLAATLGGKRLKLTTAQGELKDDPNFGPTEVYHREASAYIEAVPATGEVLVTFQGCGENTISYPPVTKAIDLTTLAVSDATGRAERPHDSSSSEFGERPGFSAASLASDPSSDASGLDGSYVSTLLTFFGFGLLLAFTPCTFPMLPILSGVLTQSAGRLSFGRGFALSASYVLAMASAYGVLGVFAAWFGGNLQALLQTPTAVTLMSAIFVVLALSMFGFYELQLPQSLNARLLPDAGRNGSIGGAALLGFTSALIVGPCVTPPLAAALVYVAQTGNTLRGSSALFALGLGMGLPLLLLGTFGATVLPKSGPWLIRIKQVFGVVLIGVAIWMMSRILALPLIAAGWGMLAAGTGAWIALIAMNRGKSVRRWRQAVYAATSSSLVIYGLLLAGGATGGWYEPLRPLAWTGIVPSANTWHQGEDGFQIVTNEADLDAAIDAGRAEGRRILVDFSADWCTECRLIERTVLADENVRQRLGGVRLIRADVTRYDAQSRDIMQRFAVVGPPTLIFLNPTGTEVEGSRTVGATAVDDFLARIAAAERG
jgi:thiol:disulfide interchange protein DsbD